MTARLRDAQFFWDADRKTTLESRLERLAHGRCSTRSSGATATRRSGSPRWRGRIAADALGQADRGRRRGHGRRGWRRPTSRPTWCSSSPSCRARWAASTRARKGSPSRSGRPSTTTTCRSASKRTRRRRARSSAPRRVTWAAVSLADKLDTLASLFGAGERPTGSRDPFGLRRQAQGVVKILVDLPELTGVDRAGRRSAQARRTPSARGGGAGRGRCARSCVERAALSCSSSAASTRATCAPSRTASVERAQPAHRAAQARGAAGVHLVGGLHAAGDRVQARAATSRSELPTPSRARREDRSALHEPAERALLDELDARRPRDRGGRWPAATTARRSPKPRRSARPSTGSSPTCS